MRYFSYNEYDPDSPESDENGGYIVTLSEEDIRKEYFPYWSSKMIEKFGKEEFEAKWSFEDCLEDWVTVHWAWESIYD